MNRESFKKRERKNSVTKMIMLLKVKIFLRVWSRTKMQHRTKRQLKKLMHQRGGSSKRLIKLTNTSRLTKVKGEKTQK